MKSSKQPPRVGLILSGCGVQDGAEIQESVIAMLALQEAGATVICLAPSKPQAQITNHLTGATEPGTRNVLVEAARIARGQVRPLAEARTSEFDAVVLPGGFGAALNLCDFAVKGPDMEVDDDLERLLRALHEERKPIGAICIAPVILAKVFGKMGARITIGSDAETARAVEKLGATHVACRVEDLCFDERNLLLTTPAYMLGESAKDIHAGIRRLSEEVVRLANLRV